MDITQRIEALGACKLIGTYKSGSAKWLEQRREGIGGSDVAAIVNYSPFKSSRTLFFEKTGQLPEQEATLPMLLGNYLESGIIEMFEAEHPVIKVHTGNFTFASTENNRFRANPDAIIEDSHGNLAILEIKHTGSYWSELPMHYRLQVMWYQFVTGLQNPATVYAVTGGTVRAFTVEYDQSLAEGLKTAVEAFCDLLDLNAPPEWDGSDSTYETARQLSPGIIDEEAELEVAADLLAARNIYEAANENLQKYKSMAIEELAGRRVGTFKGLPIVQLQQRGEGKPFLTFTKGS